MESQLDLISDHDQDWSRLLSGWREANASNSDFSISGLNTNSDTRVSPFLDVDEHYIVFGKALKLPENLFYMVPPDIRSALLIRRPKFLPEYRASLAACFHPSFPVFPALSWAPVFVFAQCRHALEFPDLFFLHPQDRRYKISVRQNRTVHQENFCQALLRAASRLFKPAKKIALRSKSAFSRVKIFAFFFPSFQWWIQVIHFFGTF